MTKSTENTSIDLSQFDQLAIENEGQELPLSFRGKPTGVSLIVVGDNSEDVRKYELNKFKNTVRKEKYANKQGKVDEFVEQQIDVLDSIRLEDALVRVIGWKNANGEFKRETLKPVLARNPQWVDDILKMSAEMGKMMLEA